MAGFFAERMKYLLSEIPEEDRKLSSLAEIMKKVEVALDEFKSELADMLHDDGIRKLEDKSKAGLWVKELENLTYKMEDAVGNWRVKSVEYVTRLNQLSSQGSLTVLAQCCIPVFTKVEALSGLSVVTFAMDRDLKRLLQEGMKLVLENAEKYKRPESFPDEDDQGSMASSVREEDKISVLYYLLPPGPEYGSDNQVISIVGFGGSGKTTLARSLYNHHRVVAYFQVRVWVHVSDIFDERMIATKLLDFSRIPYSEEAELESLLQLLQDFFSGKTVLVVFDDVWTAEASKLLQELFENSNVGSRILVTTRGEGAGIVHCLAPLSTQDCLLIMKNTVADVESELAERCEGSPLVAKILGMKLRSKDSVESIEHSEEVCMVRFRQFYHTYDTLPPYMKSCLLYPAAFFPKGAVIDALKLVLLWKSQGYLGYTLENNVEVEYNGLEWLSRLTDHSFFQEIGSQSVHKPYPKIYKMPDDAHDFVTYMAHLHGSDRTGRSFFVSPGIPVNPGLFQKLKRVTALVLSSCQLDKLPDEVGTLTCLQYLDLSHNSLNQLPRTICELYYLELLDLQFCYLLSCLPQQIGELKQMKHLRINHTAEELHYLPPGFEKLALMQTLDVFRVGGKYKDAVKKLRHLNHLEDIRVAVHGEVHFPDAKLENKHCLDNLELSFVGEGRNQEVAKSIEDLKPPPHLEMLKFEHYPRVTLPNWILAESLIKNLKRFSLRSAANISSLPAFWKLSSLEFLWLYDIPNLKHLGCEFFGHTNTSQQQHSPETGSQDMSKDNHGEINAEDSVQDAERDSIKEINDHSEANHGEITAEDPVQSAEREVAAFHCLKTLRIEYLENWETWEDANESDRFNIQVMPSLEELIIAHCPKLHGRPLRILRDTPWYQREVKNTGEAHGENMMQPSQKECSSPQADNNNKGANVAFKASYIKLKNFVSDAYMTKASAQSLKVSIPEGVLGRTMVTSYLPLASLHDWFEKDCSIFAEQMCIWSRLIYALMTPSDKERVQMASSALITTVGRQRHSYMRAEDLVDFMFENKAKLYLVPYLRPGHWELLAIVPEIKATYWFDSLQGNISLELTEFLKMVEREYVTRNLNSSIVHDSWKVVDIKHKRQVDNWESGYYVMIWMQKIALEIQDLNLESHFPLDKSSYEPNKLREVDWKWCAHVMPEFLA